MINSFEIKNLTILKERKRRDKDSDRDSGSVSQTNTGNAVTTWVSRLNSITAFQLGGHPSQQVPWICTARCGRLLYVLLLV